MVSDVGVGLHHLRHVRDVPHPHNVRHAAPGLSHQRQRVWVRHACSQQLHFITNCLGWFFFKVVLNCTLWISVAWLYASEPIRIKYLQKFISYSTYVSLISVIEKRLCLRESRSKKNIHSANWPLACITHRNALRHQGFNAQKKLFWKARHENSLKLRESCSKILPLPISSLIYTV